MEPVFGGDRVGVRADSVIEWVCAPLSVRTYVGVSVSRSVFVGGGVSNLVAVYVCDSCCEMETEARPGQGCIKLWNVP